MWISGRFAGRNVSTDEMAHFHDGVPMEWLILWLALFLKQLLDERVGEMFAQHQFCHSYLVAVGCQVVEGDEPPYT